MADPRVRRGAPDRGAHVVVTRLKIIPCGDQTGGGLQRDVHRILGCCRGATRAADTALAPVGPAT
eukprot:1136807-Lingulodinium_polyedra.AAC.1